MKKSSFSAFISRYWLYYLLWLTVCVFLFTQFTDIAVKPKKENSVGVFICAERADNKLKETLLSSSDKGLESVDVYCYDNQTETYYYLLFQTQGLSASDLIILPTSLIDEQDVKSIFYPMNNAVQSRFSGGTFYERDGAVYGVKVYDKDADNGSMQDLVAYFNGERAEDYYLFINGRSEHIDENAVGILYDVAAAYYGR